MVRNYIFGEPVETDAVVKEIASSAWCDGVFQKKEHNFIMVGDGVHETYGLFVDTPGRVTALAHRVHNFYSHDTRKAPSQEGTLSTV